jgi:hypothetical protein
MGAGDELFEREVRKVLDAKLDAKDRDKYIKMLKTQYRNRIDHINRILKDYEKQQTI